MAKILSDEQKAAIKSEYKCHHEKGSLTKGLGFDLLPAMQGEGFCSRYATIDSKSLKKSPSPWSLRDYPCKACGKKFMQCHTLHQHRKHHCKMLPTEPLPKEECLGCRKMVSKNMLYQHAKNRCGPVKQLCPACGKMLHRRMVETHTK